MWYHETKQEKSNKRCSSYVHLSKRGSGYRHYFRIIYLRSFLNSSSGRSGLSALCRLILSLSLPRISFYQKIPTYIIHICPEVTIFTDKKIRPESIVTTTSRRSRQLCAVQPLESTHLLNLERKCQANGADFDSKLLHKAFMGTKSGLTCVFL